MLRKRERNAICDGDRNCEIIFVIGMTGRSATVMLQSAIGSGKC